ncbi:MAG: NYN domain-containing protein [Flavobacteriales bacterium]
MEKVFFYIDGFNFYNGLRKGSRRKWKKFYWIDINRFCQQFIKENQELTQVKYFTAKPLNIKKRNRQDSLLKVNKAINGETFKIYQGKHFKKKIRCGASCNEEFIKHEEKQTDVSIATHILEDYILEKCDKSIIITADSDLIPVIETVSRLNNKLKRDHLMEVLFPPNNTCHDIKNRANKGTIDCIVKDLINYKSRFNKSILPIEKTINGKTYKIPSKWERHLRKSKSHKTVQ